MATKRWRGSICIPHWNVHGDDDDCNASIDDGSDVDADGELKGDLGEKENAKGDSDEECGDQVKLGVN